MQFKRILALLCLCILIATVGYSAEEYRKLGVEDLEIATGGTGAAETAVSAGGVSSTKLDSATIYMRTAPGGTIDNAIVTKQPLDAQLTTLSAPTAWRLYYSGATDWAALAFGTSGQCLKSGGASAAPTFGDCGGAADLNNSTMDNTIIGGTTAVAGTFTTVTGTSGVFTSLTRGDVSDTEFSYLSTLTSNVQTQLNAKQAYDADLAVLSAPTAWRIFYSNGSQAITELALGTSGYFLQSNGASSAPTWVASTVTSLDNTTMDNTVIGGTTPVAGTFTTLTATTVNTTTLNATGLSTLDNVVISEGTIDNTVIGGTTAVAGSFTDIVGTTITVGSVSDTEFGYLNGVTSAIQTQIDLKAPIIDPTFTNNITVDNEVTALQYNSSGAADTHYINVANANPPNSGTETTGDCYYDNTTTAWLCWDGDSWESTAVVTLGYGDNPTVDSAGKVGIDNTADQFVYYGTAERVISPQYTKDFVVKGATTADNTLLFKADTNITLTQLDCVIDPGDADGTDNVTVTLLECTSAGDTCVSSGASVVATNAGASDSTITDAAIDVDDWVKVEFSSVQGTASFLSCSIRYAITRQ